MKQLLENIKKSIYNPAYYQELLSRRLSYSWKYYSAFSFALALLFTITTSVPLVPKVMDAIHEAPGAFFAYYPDELTLRIDQGIVTSNVVEPYFLPVPRLLQEKLETNDTLLSLAVIDTMTPFTMEAWDAYKTGIWIGRDQIAMSDGSGGLRIESFGPQTNLIVDEALFREIEAEIEPYYKLFPPLMVLAIFLGMLIALGINFVYLLLGAALIFFLGHLLLKQPWSYGTSYRIGLHAITLPVILSTLFTLVALPSYRVPFLFSVVMLVIVFVNFKDSVSLPPQPAPELPTPESPKDEHTA